jgi:hypothetical protein
MATRHLLLPAVLVVGVSVGALFANPLALADLNFSSYAWEQRSLSANHEPINVLFTINGTSANTESHIGHHGWNTFVCGLNLNFYDHQVWEDTEHHMGTGGYCDAVRYHIRTNQQLDDGGPNFGTFNMGPAHYEDRPGGNCGLTHRVLDFNSARDQIANAFISGGHSSDTYYHANTDIYTTCAGNLVQGDGWVRRLVIP